MAILIAFVVGTITLWLLSRDPLVDTSGLRPRWRPQADWAAERLPRGSYRVAARDRVILERSLHLDHIFCQRGTELVFGAHGRLQRATLAADVTVHDLPLQGGTEVVFDAEGGELIEATLREPTRIGPVPCAAGRVHLRVGRHRRQVTQAVLSRDCVLRGSLRDSGVVHRIHCRGGTPIHQRPGALCAHLERFTPRTDEWAWGLRCAADHPIDIRERSGVLADDHVFDDITFPAGSAFSHVWDEDALFEPCALQVELSRSTTFAGHRLPVGASVQPHRDLVRPPGRLRRWLVLWAAPPAVPLRVHRSAPWTIAGVRIPGGTFVHIYRDGGFRYRTDRDVVHEGVVYPEGSELEHDSEGRIRGWRAGHRHGERGPHHPYRAHL